MNGSSAVSAGAQTEETKQDERLINRFDYDGDYGTVLNRFLIQAAIGYPLDDRANALQSFRHHFRGMRSQGAELDAEDRRILYGLSRSLLQARAPSAPPCQTYSSARTRLRNRGSSAHERSISPAVFSTTATSSNSPQT